MSLKKKIAVICHILEECVSTAGGFLQEQNRFLRVTWTCFDRTVLVSSPPQNELPERLHNSGSPKLCRKQRRGDHKTQGSRSSQKLSTNVWMAPAILASHKGKRLGKSTVFGRFVVTIPQSVQKRLEPAFGKIPNSGTLPAVDFGVSIFSSILY